MSIQDDLRLLGLCTAGAHENLVYVIPKHMARATKDLDMAWIMSQVVFWQQYNMTHHGTIWVVKPAKDWQAEFGMTRRKFDTAIEGLAGFGLQKKVIKSPYHNNNTSLCLRFDPHILYAKLEDSLNQTFLNVQNEQSEMAKMSNPLFTEGNTENKLKSMHPTPKGDAVRSAPKKSGNQIPPNTDTPHKPEQTTSLNGEPKVSDSTPASLDDQPQDVSPKWGGRGRVDVNTSAENKPNGYQLVMGAVAKLIFGIEGNIPKPMIKRIGLVAGYLWGSNKSMSALRPDTETPENKGNNIISDLQAFVVWWDKKFENASPPRDLVKFAEHWLAFWAVRKQFYVPVKIVTNSLVEKDNGVKIVLDRYIPSEGFTFNSEDKS